MDYKTSVIQTVDEVLRLQGKTASWTRATPLLGAVPELDSMAVVDLLTALAERFDIPIDDDDVDGTVFETVGSLVDFVSQRAPT